MGNDEDEIGFDEIVYHVCDTSQNPLIVTGIVNRPNNVRNILATDNVSEKEYTKSELTRNKNYTL